ncbi:MAG: bacterial regulatory, arsR family protein [Acidobacteria bacterium]|nr:bacterial regulatory, arsR family protein [Acidobacteriota bacterium]
MTSSGPKVRDYTDKKRRLTVDVVSGAPFELLASLFVFTLGRAELEEYEVGPEWFDQAHAAASPELLTLVEQVGCGDLWLGLVGRAYTAPEPRRVGTFLDYLAGCDANEVLRDLVMMQVHRTEATAELIDRAAGGDAEALSAIQAMCDPECAEGLKKLMGTPAAETLQRVIGVLRRFDAEVFRGGEDTVAALARDAEEKRALAASLPADRLVETATNGVTFKLQPETSGVVLVPSAVVRPWVAITECGSLRIFVYPVSAESLALADEKRLRILSLLAAGPASLPEVAERIGLAKSTVIHHMRALRTAGLVLITVGDEKEYSLRPQAIPEAGRLLQAYLSGPAAGRGTKSERNAR